jgi:hypothetical protein
MPPVTRNDNSSMAIMARKMLVRREGRRSFLVNWDI